MYNKRRSGKTQLIPPMLSAMLSESAFTNGFTTIQVIYCIPIETAKYSKESLLTLRISILRLKMVRYRKAVHPKPVILSRHPKMAKFIPEL